MNALSGDHQETRERRQRISREAALDEKARVSWLLACDRAARHVGADVRSVLRTSGKRGRGSNDTVARARKFACYLALVVCNVEPARLARVNGMHRKTLSQNAEWVEERRDDPMFDGLVEGLEDALWRAAASIVLTKLGAGDVDVPAAA